MAMQTGVGFSKILILAGAGTFPTEFLTSIILFYFSYYFNFDFNLLISFSGYTGTVLLKNGKLSDMLGELQVSFDRFDLLVSPCRMIQIFVLWILC